DSWHSGTGATDNGAGVAVAMEAARILQALNLKPRRTIRVALWSGEEQGLLGSRAHVAKHFGKLETATPATTAGGNGNAAAVAPAPVLVKGPDYEKLSVYFNLDNGTGKIRGVYLQGNESVRGLFREWLAPFKDMGATTLSISNTGGTDHYEGGGGAKAAAVTRSAETATGPKGETGTSFQVLQFIWFGNEAGHLGGGLGGGARKPRSAGHR
ncbi:MAG: M20/M25/M40 family metallo-hydrolase, partial [Pyrinomonadaceae bacterium]